MFKCMHCGHEFEEIDRKHYDSSTGVWEEYCPNCRSEDIEEAEQCDICGEWHAADYLKCGVCKKCAERDDPREAYAYGAERKTCVELNGFLAYAYSAQEIEAALWQDLMSSRPGLVKEYANRFITDDLGDFAEWWKEEHKDD